MLKTFNLKGYEIGIEKCNPHTHKWEYEAIEQRYGIKIKQFKKQQIELSITLKIRGSINEIKDNLNDLFEEAEKDILNMTPGKFFIGDYFLEGYFIESEVESSDTFYGYKKNVTFLAPYPFWIKESEYKFEIGDIKSSNNKQYPHKYAYRYANGLTNSAIQNNNFCDSNFRMIVYGPVLNPAIIIGEYTYLVNILLEAGEYMEIDSQKGTVIKVMNSGLRIQAFHNRDKKKSVFQKISAGRQEVNWTGKFKFDIIIYEERSEPKW